MTHPIYHICAIQIQSPYTLHITFNDKTERTINFRPVLSGQLYGPLSDLNLFNQVEIDPEVHTIVWPNGADFDPATLHDWPQHVQALTEMAKCWDLHPA